MQKFYSLLFVILTLSTQAFAIITIVENGETLTTTLEVVNPGDEAIIERGGAIETVGAGEHGVDMQASDQSTLNKGSISTTGLSASGINSTGADAAITNRGFISTTREVAHGILSTGVDAVITNTGSISTIGGGAPGSESNGIQSIGANATITNRGSISTTADFSYGINSQGANATITNTGSISTTGVDAIGIRSIGADATVTNSGVIKSEQSFALNFTGTNPSLTLLRGSNLQGEVFSTNPLDLTVGKGLNLLLELEGTFDTLSIDDPFVLVQNGNETIAVVDRAGFALQSDVVADISDSILGGIYRYRIGFPCDCSSCCCEGWVQGIGSYLDRGHNKTVAYTDRQGGFLVGANRCLCDGYAGVFGGVVWGKGLISKDTQRADTTTYVGGLTFEKICCNTFFGGAIALGYTNWDNERLVFYNLAEGGVQKAKVDTGGFFVTPEFTVAHRFGTGCSCPIVSATVRYAGLFLGDFKEKGSDADLKAKDRDIGLITGRLELSAPYSVSNECCCYTFEPYIGGFVRHQTNGKKVKAELLDEKISFDNGYKDNILSFLFGFRGTKTYNCVDLFLTLEGDFDNDKGQRIIGQGGFSYCF